MSKTIWEWYTQEKEKLHQNYVLDSEKLELELKTKQLECSHIEEAYNDSTFYAMGETWPGMTCVYCGKTRHLTEKEKKKHKYK